VYRSTPDDVADVMAVAERFADRLFRAAHRAGTPEPAEAHLADALLLMARRAAGADTTGPVAPAEPGAPAASSGPEVSAAPEVSADGRTGADARVESSSPVPAGPGVGGPVRSGIGPRLPLDLHPLGCDPPSCGASGPAASRGSPDAARWGRVVPKEVIVRVDWDALTRGWPLDGEVCEIAGLGPVPVSVVKAMLDSGDAVLKAVVTKGVDVVTVAHLGRRPSAFQKTGLRWLDLVCVEAGCGQRAYLEVDHVIPWTTNRITLLQLLQPRCRHHHRAKTRTDMAHITTNKNQTRGGP
jgi:hypothetical protein